MRGRDLLQEIAFSLRRARRERRVVATIVLVLALCVAADATAFVPVRRLLWGPLPFAHAEQLVLVWGRYRRPTVERGALSPPGLAALQGRSDLFVQVGGFARQRFDLATDLGPERIFGAGVTRDFFATLGVRPQIGRLFSPEDFLPGTARSVVLSDAFWRLRWGGDPAVLGRQVTLDDARYHVVGVLPAAVQLPADAELWTADPLDPGAPTYRWGNEYLTVVARRRTAALGALQAALAVQGGRLRALHPDVYGGGSGYSLAALPLRDVLGERARPMTLAAFAALSLVLLIAAADTAALLCCRVVARRDELRIRSALGAPARRVAVQVAIENGVVVTAAVLLGAALVPAAAQLLARVLPPAAPLAAGAAGGAAFCEAAPAAVWLPWAGSTWLALLAGVAVPPALYGGALAAAGAGRREGRCRRGNRRPSLYRATGLLVGLAVCLAFALAQATTLLAVSVRQLRAQPLGFEPRSVLVAKAPPRLHDAPAEAQLLAYHAELLRQLRLLPVASSAATGSTLPLNAGTFRVGITVASGTRDLLAVQCELRVVSSGYFRTLGIPLLAGRELADEDDERGDRVAVMDARLAGLLGPGGRPLAATLDLGDGRRRRVVGVAAVVRQDLAAEAAPPPFVYLPFRQYPVRNISLAVRMKPGTDPAAAWAGLRLAVSHIDRRQAVYDAATLEGLLQRAMAPARAAEWILGALTAVAWLLLAAGVHGVVSYRVQLSRRELGVRSVLGARAVQLLALQIRRCAASLAAGLGAGAVLGFWLNKTIASLLFAAAPWRLGSFGLAAAAMSVTAVAGAAAAALREVSRAPADLLQDAGG